jgi:hypothetical protein
MKIYSISTLKWKECKCIQRVIHSGHEFYEYTTSYPSSLALCISHYNSQPGVCVLFSLRLHDLTSHYHTNSLYLYLQENYEYETETQKETPSKLKLSHYTPRRRLRGEVYSSYSFSTSALGLDDGELSASHPASALARGKDPLYPLYKKLGGPQSRSVPRGWRKNLFTSAGDQTSNTRSSSP